jgi:ATP-dependent DNA helicase RecG
LLLLGNYSAAGPLNPHTAQTTWRLIGEEEGHEHFGPPFPLNTTKVCRRIRNIQAKSMRPGPLLPEHVNKYDQRIVLEGIHNALPRRATRVIRGSS